MSTAEKKALGKGLSALIADNDTETNKENKNMLSLQLSEIEANPHQPRKQFKEEELKELADSIREHGVIQPITVRKVESGKYQIIAGERRYQASKLANKEQILVVVKTCDDLQTFELALIENLQREDLDPIEEAIAYDKLIKQFSYTQDQIGKKISKSRTYVTNILRLLSLPEDVKSLLSSGKLSSGHARTILNMPNVSELANKIVNDNLSVREVEQHVKKIKGTPKKPGKKRHSRLIREGAGKHFEKDSDLLEVEKLLSQTIDMPVSINDTLDGGEVVIEFKSLEQLDWIIERLGHEKLNF